MNKDIKKVNKSTFKAIKSLEDKNNYKRLFRIEKDGSVIERIFLNVSDIFLREEIIFSHYLSFLVRNFIQNLVGVNIISRDDPWDFSVELSNGLSFNVEITSIADNEWLYEKMKREEKYEEIIIKKKIKLRELKKIDLWFENEESKLAIREAEEKSVDADELIKNPFLNEGGRIFISDSKNREKSLAILLLEAIKRKNNKRHKDKEKTILIIDNRTSVFEIEDYQEARKEIEDKLTNILFPEIYFYTGYCSDNDGSNAEYSFAPIKLPEEKYEQLEKRIKQGELKMNKNGIAYD